MDVFLGKSERKSFNLGRRKSEPKMFPIPAFSYISDRDKGLVSVVKEFCLRSKYENPEKESNVICGKCEKRGHNT